MPLISVIIVNYKVKYYAEQSIRSVYASCRDGRFEVEVFVVDNASNDDSVEYLRQQFPVAEYPNLHLIANPRNVGFSKANNQAVRQAAGDYILFLNPDTFLAEDTLSECMDIAGKIPGIGGMGVKMLRTDGTFALESRRGLPTPWTAFCKMCGLCKVFPKSRFFGKYYMGFLDKEKVEAVDILSGAFLMVPKKVLDKCGLFDETFFMYGEDIDLSYRILLSGSQNYYIPAPILHYKGESTEKSSYRYVHIFYEAMLIFFKKHFRHYRWGLSVIIRTAIVLKALLALLSRLYRYVMNFLRSGEKRMEDKFLFVGRAENIPAVRKIAEQWQIDVTCIEADENSKPGGHLELKQIEPGTTIAIYDTEAYSYKKILGIFEASPHNLEIGTYTPESKVVITPRATYDLR